MPERDAMDSQLPRKSVFLSYASEDRQAARSLRDALADYGLNVWYDESELGGGEAWDQKIRRQIRECDFFMPLVSAQTEARHEGYFRREWRLAVERTLDMADDHPFLLPVVIDDTQQVGARVPEKFLTVQWLKVPAGQPTRALESLCRRLASSGAKDPEPDRPGSGRPSAGRPSAGGPEPDRPSKSRAAVPPLLIPEFPREEPGQRIRFWVEVFAWAWRSAWTGFKRLPRWIRWVAIVWLAIALVSRCDSSRPRHSATADMTPAKAEKLKAIAQQYQGSLSRNDLVKLGKEIAQNFPDDSDDSDDSGDSGDAAASRPRLLATAFTAPAGDASAAKLADTTFATIYGMASISHHGQVGLSKQDQPVGGLTDAVERGKASHSLYVLCGAVDKAEHGPMLTVKIARVADGSVIWSKAYAGAATDPAKIAADVEAHLPPLDSP
jgi:TolB-like protein